MDTIGERLALRDSGSCVFGCGCLVGLLHSAKLGIACICQPLDQLMLQLARQKSPLEGMCHA